MQEAWKSSRSWSFPLLRAAGRLGRRFCANWIERHQLTFNLCVHLIGIPMAFCGLILLFFEPLWGLLLVSVGYLLQYVGHRAEGNDMGEWAGIKRLLGLPYVGIAPRWQTGPAPLTPP